MHVESHQGDGRAERKCALMVSCCDRGLKGWAHVIASADAFWYEPEANTDCNSPFGWPPCL